MTAGMPRVSSTWRPDQELSCDRNGHTLIRTMIGARVVTVSTPLTLGGLASGALAHYPSASNAAHLRPISGTKTETPVLLVMRARGNNELLIEE